MPASPRPELGGPAWHNSTAFVGRAAELALLHAALERAAQSAPAVVVISGPPGMGKTRLATEALRRAAAAGFETLVGRADELGRDSAYAPVVEALAPWLAAQPPVRLRRLVADLPALALVFAGLPVQPPAPLADPALERARMQEAFARLVARITDERPLAVLIDDLHAADPDTLALTRHLATGLADRPVLLVGTTRTGVETDRTAALADAVVRAGWHVDHLTVEPLPAPDTAALLHDVLGQPVSRRAAAAVAERCAGRPLFIQAMAASLADARRESGRAGPLDLDALELPLPERVHSYLANRLVGRTTDEWTVLTRLAVARAALGLDILLPATRLPAGQALDALERLERDGLVLVCDPAPLTPGDPDAPGAAEPSSSNHRPDHDTYRIVHALLRDTVLADVSPTAVRRAHADLARAYLDRAPADYRIAEHVLQAGPLIAAERAVPALVDGATRARRLGATADTERFLAEAVYRAGPDGPDRPGRLAGLLADLAEAQRTGSGDVAARRNWRAARDAYARAAHPDGVARAERMLATFDWADGDLTAAHAHFDAAAQALAGRPASIELGELWYARLTAALRTGDIDTVRDLTRRLLGLTRQLDAPSLRARAHLAQAVLAYRERDYATMAAANERAQAAAEAAGDVTLKMRALDQLAIGAASEGDVAGLRAHSEAELALARQAGSRMLEPWPRVRVAVADLLAGDWDAALRGTSEVVSFASGGRETRGVVSVSAVHAWVLAWRGRLAEAGRYLDEAMRLAPADLHADRNIFGVVDFARMVLALARNDPAAAVAVGQGLAGLTDGWFPLLAAAELGEARVLAGQPDQARVLADRIRGVRTHRTRLPAVLGDWLDALAGAAGEPDVGAAASVRAGLARAGSGFTELGLPFHGARADLALARAFATAGRTSEAAAPAGAALTVFDRLGADRQSQQARRLLRDVGVVPSRGRGRRPADDELSPRELEVARLVATGRSNAEVAVELFISPRTVTTHLQHIYARLGLSSRVALTRYLADSGLLGAKDSAGDDSAGDHSAGDDSAGYKSARHEDGAGDRPPGVAAAVQSRHPPAPHPGPGR